MAATRRRIDVDGLRVAYAQAGDGPLLLLLHGYVGDGPGTWGPQLESLADEFTVVAWDAPGAGGSADPPPGFGLPDFADCAAGLVDALGLGRPHVAGHSFGGALALELHRRHPALARSLVLSSAYAGWAGSLPRAEVERRLEQALRLAELPPRALVDALLPTLVSPDAPAAVVAALAANLAEVRAAGLTAMARAIAAADLRDVLPGIRVPTLVIGGALDVRAPVAVAEGLHAAISGSRLVVVPGVGHTVGLEAPDRYDAELRAFLRSVPG